MAALLGATKKEKTKFSEKLKLLIKGEADKKWKNNKAGYTANLSCA